MLDKNLTENDTQSVIAPAGKKFYYSISEVCALLGIEQRTLRSWEAEITQLRPKRLSSGNRAYRDKDIELIRRIKSMVYDEKLTPQAVTQILAEERREARVGKKPQSDRDAVWKQLEESLHLECLQLEQSATSLPVTSIQQASAFTEIRRELREILAILGG